MKKITVIILSIFVVFNVSAQKNKGIDFLDLTFEEALAKAAANKKGAKLVFVDCYTSWCGPCKDMAENVFTLPEYGAYFNANFVNIKIDMESEAGVEFNEKYGKVGSYPTFIIFDAGAKEMARLVGSKDADVFLQEVKNAVQPGHTLPELKAAYEADKSMKTGLPYLSALNKGRKTALASELAQELYGLSEDEEKFSLPFYEMLISNTKYNDPFFTQIIFDKPNASRILGTEVINEMILLRVYANSMYNIYSGERTYSNEEIKEIEQAAIVLALLGTSPALPATHLGWLALFVAKNDIDGLIEYFEKEMPAVSESFQKTMLEGTFVQILNGATEEQKASGKRYFNTRADAVDKEMQKYTRFLGRIQ